MKINKTNVARLLDKAKVAYQLVPYEVDENDLSATHVADQLGENVAQVFKTLVLHEMIPVKELLPLTGYIRGGCSPIGMKKHFPTYIHHTAGQFDHIYVSAGQRGLQIRIAPGDLIREARAEVADVIREI